MQGSVAADCTSERMVRSLSRFSRCTSGLSIAFGVMVLTGWALHIQWLKGIIPGQVPVKANTGVCFVLIGIALWLGMAGPGRRFTRVTARALALLASGIGLLSFLECWTGWDLGIDQLLFTAGPDDLPGSVRLALMSPITAADFFLLGIAIVGLDNRRRRWSVIQNVLPVLAAVAAMFGILDFVLDPQNTHTHIAPLTALVLFLFSFGLLCARADVGFGRLLLSGTVGGVLCRRLLPPAILIPTAIAWLRWKGQQIGLYSDWSGLAMMTVVCTSLLAALTAWTAYLVHRSDADRSEAEASAKGLAAIVTCSNDAIIGKTLDGIVTSWNAGAEAIYGYSAEEMIGQPLARVIPPELLSQFQEFLSKVRLGESVRHHETERITKDGKRIWVSISISPLTDDTGKLVGACTVARDIGDRKQAEQKLQQASQYTRSLIEASLDPLVTISKAGKVTDVNAATEQATGLARERIVGNDFCDYFTEPQKAREGYQRVFEKGFVRDYPLAIRSATGHVIDVLYNASVFRNAAGEIEGVFAAARDITERKQAEEAQRRSVMELKEAQRIARLGSWTLEIKTGAVTWTEELYSMLGLDSADPAIPYQDQSRIFTPASWKVLSASLEKTVREGIPYELELETVLPDGSHGWMLSRGEPVHDNGQVTRLRGVALDITARKRAEKALDRSEARYRSLVTATAQIVWTTDLNGRVVDDMPMWRAFAGMTQEQIQGWGWINSLHPDDRTRTAEVWNKAVADKSLYNTEYRIRRSDGEYRDVAVRGVPVSECDGTIREWIGTCTDITERKQAEQAVQTERRRFREVLDQLPVYVVLLTPDYHVALDNTMFRQRFGESHGRPCYEFLFQRNTPCEICETYSVMKTGLPRRWKWTGPDGCNYDIFDFPFTDSDGSPLILEMGMDITERTKAEAEVNRLNSELERRVMERTAQLEAANKELEAFTYSVSHDLRAPLRHISGFSKLLSEEFAAELPSEAQHHVQRIQDGTLHMGQLVDDLLNLGRVGRKELSLQVAGLRSIVDEVIQGLKPDIGDRNVEWQIRDLPYVECDTALMHQVFQNLLANALKFTRPREKAVIEIGQEQRDGRSVVFVRDNGVGFSMKYADKLFGVFQRLHRAEDFEGTGVGLATVQRIIQKHGGRIWAEAELDKGAAFYFELGACEQGTSQAAYAGAKS